MFVCLLGSFHYITFPQMNLKQNPFRELSFLTVFLSEQSHMLTINLSVNLVFVALFTLFVLFRELSSLTRSLSEQATSMTIYRFGM